MRCSIPTFPSIPILAVLALATFPTQAQVEPDMYMKLFDDRSLEGWKGRAGTWQVKDGAIAGGGALSSNTFLVTDSLFSDFHLVLDARMSTPGSRNSGVLYRGEVMNASYLAKGYQLDISDNYWGSFYHELGSELGWTPVSTCSEGGANDWRTIEIIADGPKVTHMVNGKKCFEKLDFKVLKKGVIGLQMHSPGNFTVEFRKILIRPLNGSFSIPEGQVYRKDGTPLGPTGVRKTAASRRAFAPRLFRVDGKALSPRRLRPGFAPAPAAIQRLDE